MGVIPLTVIITASLRVGFCTIQTLYISSIVDTVLSAIPRTVVLSVARPSLSVGGSRRLPVGERVSGWYSEPSITRAFRRPRQALDWQGQAGGYRGRLTVLRRE